MKPLILLVDDNEEILYNLQIILKANNYDTIIAKNGKEALEVLTRTKKTPDLIISDIVMPEMNGYDFFKEVSKNPFWNLVPFIFLSGKSAPDDIRFGKTLGIDDYLTKPFEEADLLAIIAGKINRSKKILSINDKIKDISLSNEIRIKPTANEKEKSEYVLLKILWDDRWGPKLAEYYPEKESIGFSIETIGIQLYQGAVSIYGYSEITKAEGLLLTIKNINKQGYLYFDSYPDPSARGKQRDYMLALIAPKISYYISLKIREIFKEISKKIKSKKKWNLKTDWEELINLFFSA